MIRVREKGYIFSVLKTLEATLFEILFTVPPNEGAGKSLHFNLIKLIYYSLKAINDIKSIDSLKGKLIKCVKKYIQYCLVFVF